MGFLDRLLGREKKAEDMPAEPMEPGTMPEPGGMTEPPPDRPEGMAPEPGSEGSRPDREMP
jgi:hypothetical protein